MIAERTAPKPIDWVLCKMKEITSNYTTSFHQKKMIGNFRIILMDCADFLLSKNCKFQKYFLRWRKLPTMRTSSNRKKYYLFPKVFLRWRKLPTMRDFLPSKKKITNFKNIFLDGGSYPTLPTSHNVRQGRQQLGFQ